MAIANLADAGLLPYFMHQILNEFNYGYKLLT